MRGTSWLIPLAILGVAAILYVSSWGVAVTHDSVLYLSAGENLSQGLGMQRAGPNGELRPIAHYPPLYPMLLAALLLLGMDEVHAATWLSAVLFGVNIGIAGMIVLWLTRRLHGALLAQFAILVSPVMLETHLNALSEPLFFTWLLLNLWLLAMYLETQRRPLLIAAGVACSLASLSRYVGGALGGAGIVILALRRRTPIKRRLEDVAILAGVSLCPLLLWYVRNLILAGSSANRALVYHPVSYLVLRAAFDTLSGRLLPEQLSLRIRAVLLLAIVSCAGFLVAWGLAGLRRTGCSHPEEAESVRRCLRWGWISSLFIVTYIAVVGFSLAFLDASTRIDDRILSPIYLVLVICALGFASVLARPARLIGTAFCVLLVGIYAIRSWPPLADIRLNGRGFNSREWLSSETAELVRGLEPDATIISNESLAVEFLIGRPVYGVPEAVDSVTGTQRSDLGSQLTEMRHLLEEPGAVLVVFTGYHYRVEMPPMGQLTEGLVQVAATADGLVFVDERNAGTWGTR